ncbi:MAG: cupin domain-containing protein [Planctomycetaceae bacterium]|nr:cupin domain-containing protein [Planctomycetaceae bacterium]MCA9108313.1 cupin domain-containing protein [Planctomycetaceae bacterium]
MSIPHANPGQLIDVSPLGEKLSESQTYTLLKTSDLEVIRLVLPAGKQIAEHKAPAEITVQCLEGEVAFTTLGKTETLTAGRMLYLSAAEPHALEATQDSSVLVTLLLQEHES